MLHEMLPFNSNCLSKVAKRHADFAIRLPVGRTISKQWVQFHYNLLRLYLKRRGVNDRWAEWGIVHQGFDKIVMQRQ